LLFKSTMKEDLLEYQRFKENELNTEMTSPTVATTTSTSTSTTTAQDFYKGEKLYTTSTEVVYKTQVKIGRKATKEELKKTCQEVGLMPACAYRDNCDYNPTNYCSSVSVETRCGGYGNGLDSRSGSGLSGLSGLICNENLAKNCPQLDRIFFSYSGYLGYNYNSYSVGNVDGQLVDGENVVSSVSHPVYSICVTNI